MLTRYIGFSLEHFFYYLCALILESLVSSPSEPSIYQRLTSSVGPILGGLLADPAGTYPDSFGKIGWLVKYPYAPPNLMSAFFLFISATAVVFGLDEVNFQVKFLLKPI